MPWLCAIDASKYPCSKQAKKGIPSTNMLSVKACT